MLGCGPVRTLGTFSHIPDGRWAGVGWAEREISLPHQGHIWVLHFASAPGGLLGLAYPNGSHTCPSECRELHPDLTIRYSFKTAVLLLVQCFFPSSVSCNYHLCSRTEPRKQSLGYLSFRSPSLCNLFGSSATGEGPSNQRSQQELNLCLIFCHHSPSSIAHPCKVHLQL